MLPERWRPPGPIWLHTLVLTGVGWLIFALVVWWAGGTWPPPPAGGSRADTVENVIVLALVVHLLVSKAHVMLARSFTWTRFSASLIATELVFAALYLYLLIAMLWAAAAAGWVWTLDWVPGHVRWPNRVTPVDVFRWLLIVVCVWGWWEVMRLPDEPGPDPLETECAALRAENARLRARLGMTDG